MRFAYAQYRRATFYPYELFHQIHISIVHKEFSPKEDPLDFSPHRKKANPVRIFD